MAKGAATRRICIIGAGSAGLAAAKELADLGIAFDCLERNDNIGGNWYGGVYNSTHLISSRDTTAFKDFPMPRDYPDFPSREQMLAYIRSFAEQHDLLPHVHLNTEVVEIGPLNASGTAGWRVRLADGQTREYAGVVVANGHLWDKRLPTCPGEFAGRQLHSKDYKDPGDLAGSRVLVVGAGNSGCDLAVEAANAGFACSISMRRGYWFIPKMFFGIPRGEMNIYWLPKWLHKAIFAALIKVTVGSYERYGLPRPDHPLLSRPPIVNSELLYLIRHGLVAPKPDIARLQGKKVHFVDGTQIEVDTMIWATGYNVSFPFLDHGLLEWERGVPKRVAAGTLAPGLAGLYFNGLVTPRGGNQPIHSATGRLIGRCVRAQELLNHPIADEFVASGPAVARMDYSVPGLLREIRRAERVVEEVVRRHASVQAQQHKSARTDPTDRRSLA